MNVSFDPEADALYISLRKTGVARSKVIEEDTILDYDEHGDVVGIEILHASQRADNPRSIGYALAESPPSGTRREESAVP